MDTHTPGRAIAAVLAVAVLSGCGAASRAHQEAVPAASTEHPTAAAQLANPVIVRRPLSAAKHAELVTWMNHWRDCMAGHGVALPPPQVYPRHVSIDVSAVAGYVKPGAGLPATPSTFMQKSMSCVESLGGTPATFLRTGGIVDVFKGTCAVQGSTKPKQGGQ